MAKFNRAFWISAALMASTVFPTGSVYAADPIAILKDTTKTDETPKDTDKQEEEKKDELSGKIDFTQKAKTFYKDDVEQTYTYSYTGDEEKYTEKALEFSFNSDEFAADKLQLGGWDAGSKATVKIEDKDGKVTSQEIETEPEFDLSQFSSISKITIETENNKVSDIKDIKLIGIVKGSKVEGKSFSMKARLKMTKDGGDILEKKSEATMKKPDYIYTKPVVSSDASVFYRNQDQTIRVNGMSGSGTDKAKSYNVELRLPTDVALMDLSLPLFEGAKANVTINGKDLTDMQHFMKLGVITGPHIEIKVVPEDGAEWKQTSDLILKIRNISYQAEKTIPLTATGKIDRSVMGEESFESDVFSLNLKPTAAEPTKPEGPDEPDDSDKPEEPDEPDEPEEPNEDNGKTKKEPKDNTQKAVHGYYTPAKTLPAVTPTTTATTPTTTSTTDKEEKEETKTPKKVQPKEPSVSPIPVPIQNQGTYPKKPDTKQLLNNTNTFVDTIDKTPNAPETTPIEDVDKGDTNTEGQEISTEIRQKPSGKIKAKASETIQNNRTLQLAAIIAGLAAVIILLVIMLMKKFGNDEKKALEASKEEEKKDSTIVQETPAGEKSTSIGEKKE